MIALTSAERWTWFIVCATSWKILIPFLSQSKLAWQRRKGEVAHESLIRWTKWEVSIPSYSKALFKVVSPTLEKKLFSLPWKTVRDFFTPSCFTEEVLKFNLHFQTRSSQTQNYRLSTKIRKTWNIINPLTPVPAATGRAKTHPQFPVPAVTGRKKSMWEQLPPQVARTISHVWAQRTSEILFLPSLKLFLSSYCSIVVKDK